MNSHKSILIIMDGWGLAENPSASAISKAKTPFFDHLMSNEPNIRLEASGLAVGLPEGQMGNSEVGHMNIGAGRVVYQDLVKINLEIKEGGFANNQGFKDLVKYCLEQDQPLHLMGLLSDGGVHSSIEHVKGIISYLSKAGLTKVFIHVFTDGRDTAPDSGAGFIQQLETCLKENKTGKIASVIGRYYAMDRDKRWERTKLAYDLIVKGEGTQVNSATEAITQSYEAGKTDEFVEAFVISENGEAIGKLENGHAVLFFNFRTDRGRQLTHVLSQEDMPEEGMKTLDLHYTTMTRYDASFKGVNVLYEKEQIQNGLGEYLANQGKTQIRIAETEKYPHVTFFFNGGREIPMEGEEHLLCASPKVATYDLQPEMSAEEIKTKIIEAINERQPDFICLNFANPDMVGHTGVFDAAVIACETVDQCTQEVANAAFEAGYKVFITADHGNADRMVNPDGSTHTAHTTALVPLILMDPEGKFTFEEGALGKLGDLAPTILTAMGMDIPSEMTGEVLIKS